MVLFLQLDLDLHSMKVLIHFFGLCRHLAVFQGLDQDVVVEAVVIGEISGDHTMVEEEMGTVVGAVAEDGHSCR